MIPERDCTDFLRDIVDAAEKAQRFVEDMDFAAFEADAKTLFATTRAIEIIGEAARHIPKSVREMYPDIPWREMVGMRDKLIHGYFGVDRRRVWDTIQIDLPMVWEAVGQVLAELERGEGQ
jgi:uncharacterized protein with HEPN domain